MMPPGSAAPDTIDPRRLHIVLVAGEASGDLLGAELVNELRQRFPQAQFSGIGGEQMRAAGVDVWQDCSALSVMGLFEVLRHLLRLWRLRRQLGRRIIAMRPDVFIGIDAPDFNLGLERRLKRAGIRTVHYVSPSIWAWREGRAAKISQCADRVLCLFPMEPAIYARHGVEARFVGHPLARSFPMDPDRHAARRALNLPQQAPVLALLPGSRLGEIKRLWPDFIETARRLSQAMPDLQIVVPAATPHCRQALEPALATSQLSRITLHDGNAQALMVAADVVLLASGTAALEAMLCKRPMVVGYRISAMTYRIVMALGLLKVNRYSLPNVLANEPIVPEFMQHDCTPENLSEAVLRWFTHQEACATLIPRYNAIHARLQGEPGMASAAVAELIASTTPPIHE